MNSYPVRFKPTHEEKIEVEVADIRRRLTAIEGRLTRLQTIGAWLFVVLLASYTAILTVALRIH